MKRLSISTFKDNCSAVLRKAQKHRKPVIITRRGKPLAMILPISSPPAHNWIGSMRDEIKIIGDIVSSANDPDD